MGARALTKHAARSKEGFWGENKGSEISKNQSAHERLTYILDNVVWTNVHILPPNEVTVECRIREGYGIRWTIDSTFRGFLEP